MGKIGDKITADHKIPNVENESRGGHTNAPVVHELNPELFDGDKGSIGNNVVFTKIYSSVTEAGHNSHRSVQIISSSLSRFTMEP